MTLHIVDVSRHQVERSNPLDLVLAKANGFGAVNIQLDRGKQEDVLSPWARPYADTARRLSMGICTYRWLDGRISGTESAQRAYARMQALGGPVGMAHAVDTESTATEKHVRDYLNEMNRLLLGRPIALYTGDWWWMAAGRKWGMADIAPYLWSSPTLGYPGYYPGDASTMWTGFGDWPVLTAMQYAVKPIQGTGDCSLTAVRDMAAWDVLVNGARCC